MAWAVWLSVPITATILAALFTWWSGRVQARADDLDTAGAMRAHQSYLDALTIPARSSRRPEVVASLSGTVTPHLDSAVQAASEGAHRAAG